MIAMELRRWARAWDRPGYGWCVGFYTADTTGGAESWHSAADERTAKREALDHNHEALTQLYHRWMTEQGLKLGSADEVDHDQLTPEQSAWIYSFVARWEYERVVAR